MSDKSRIVMADLRKKAIHTHTQAGVLGSIQATFLLFLYEKKTFVGIKKKYFHTFDKIRNDEYKV